MNWIGIACLAISGVGFSIGGYCLAVRESNRRKQKQLERGES